MDNKSLMLGDWVQHRDGTPYQIAEIGGMVCIDAEQELFASLEDIQPIPLTAEILEKNGFIKDANKDDKLTDTYHLLVPTGFERKSFTIQVSLYKEPICGVSTLVKCWGWLPPYNGGMNDIHLCGVNYVHELQHALKLCGIEKEITL